MRRVADREAAVRRAGLGDEIAGPFNASPEFCETLRALISMKPDA